MTKLRILTLLLMIFTGNLLGQSTQINSFNVPDEIRACLRSHLGFDINESVNPFYISGNFDGRGTTEFVVQVVNKNSDRKGLLFCLSPQKTILWGAGAPNSALKENQKWPFDSWMLIPKGSKHLSIYPKIRFDAIAVVIADEGGGLVYWDGRGLQWQPEE